MDLLQTAVLALVQGLTAFLPVGPQAHDALLRALLGWPDQSLQVQLGTHLGLALAATTYLYRDVGAVLLGALHLGTGRRTRQARLAG